MQFEKTSLAGVRLVHLNAFEDERGMFARTFCQREFAEEGLETQFVQANLAQTINAGTVRGLHYQSAPHEEVKIIRCINGGIYDVVVDMREGSPTYLEHFGAELTAENGAMMYVPRGFAHGYQSLTANATVFYMSAEYYEPQSECGLRPDDRALGIDWPVQIRDLSEKDQSWPLLEANR